MNLLSFAVLLSFTNLNRGVLAEQEVAISCGADTVFDSSTNSCLCSQDFIEDDPNVINIAGIFDITTYDWGPTIFEVTVQLINEGRMEALASPNQRLEYSLRNAECDATTATRAYWDIRTNNSNRPPQGIIGARCSGASIALARISELEGVPHLSPASNDASLSDEENFPFFSRVVSPNNVGGEVGALVALLRSFKWERVTILATDTAFSQGAATEFRKIWTGQHDGWFGRVGHSDTIRIGADGLVDDESVQQTLGSIPFDDPSVNSRIVLLFAHSQHAFQILEQAANLQPDTIWVGLSSWIGRDDPNTNFRWLPSTPGYLGVTTFRNRDSFYQDFMDDLQAFQQARGEEPWDELPAFGAEFVDSIVAMTKALATTSNRRDGAAVVRALRALDFAGVSGRVHFTPNGDRKDPKFSLLNSAGASNGEILWTEIGSTGTTIGSTEFSTRQVCIAQQGCIDLAEAPGDTYPEIKEPLPWWIFLLLVIFLLALMYVSYRYWRSKQKKRAYKMELEDFRKSVVGMRAAESHYMPTFVDSKTINVKQSLRRSSSKSAVSKSESAVWCWQETACVMDQHHASEVMGDPANCWIKYDSLGNTQLEAAFQNKKKIHTPRAGYVVDFQTMTQKKTKTGFTRNVKRFTLKNSSNGTSNGAGSVVDPSDVRMGDLLPNALRGEPQMVLVEGDVVQITVQRDDGWSFGSKLHQADESLAKELVIASTNTAAEGPKSDDVNVSSATGWFLEDVTRVATETDVKAIQASMGGEDALSPPAHWDIMQDPSTAQRFEVQKGSVEYDAVAQHFLSTVNQPTSRVKVRVVKIERVQNLAMWQSYIVKRQAICHRETGHTGDKAVLNQAVKRYERERLWHGSNVEVVTKIFQQGFNRSFCGKNATMYGKGVYYARDASYSASTTYSVPDRKGLQYMMACRVIVGEYCKGRQDVVTPDVRDMFSHQLYDTTVDNVSSPSIYVTYHDAQAYPEYLVTFQK